MDASTLTQRIFRVEIRRLLFIAASLVAVIVIYQCFSFPYISQPDKGPNIMVVANSSDSKESKSTHIRAVQAVSNSHIEHDDTGSNELAPEIDPDSGKNEVYDIREEVSDESNENKYNNSSESSDQVAGIELAPEIDPDSGKDEVYETLEEVSDESKETKYSNSSEASYQVADIELAPEIDPDSGKNEMYETREEVSDEGNEKKYSNSSEASDQVAGIELVTGNLSLVDFEERLEQTQAKESKVSKDLAGLEMVRKYEPKLKRRPMTLSQMTSILLKSSVSSGSMKPRWSSARDRDLLSAKLEIEKAPIVRSSKELSPLVFRNVSKFIRSYELMEQMLKVYVYKEGDKPIFHQPYMRGIYASEGWFMKLMEASKKFVVRDPKKAHLFYLPFSSKSLRVTLNKKDQFDKNNLEKYLKRYVDSIAKKYRFWNRTDGADHFLVACHDWASYLTRKTMKNCIRSLCNANVARDFKIGKDTSFPVTYIKSAEAPLAHIGGKLASERSILAFFAGGLHGYLRPILLHHWERKSPDMKIFGPMPRDLAGKEAYRDYMKSSKYCICARGYEVHSPRVVESIFYECVPVIISDNYVPPFFEVLNWEAFSVFVRERDVHDLRNILLSIPYERYESLHSGVKMVQKHFFWHKSPLRYDLFHMTLHSIWNNRLIQLRTR